MTSPNEPDTRVRARAPAAPTERLPGRRDARPPSPATFPPGNGDRLPGRTGRVPRSRAPRPVPRKRPAGPRGPGPRSRNAPSKGPGPPRHSVRRRGSAPRPAPPVPTPAWASSSPAGRARPTGTPRSSRPVPRNGPRGSARRITPANCRTCPRSHGLPARRTPPRPPSSVRRPRPAGCRWPRSRRARYGRACRSAGSIRGAR